jgi:hypothetical protein
LPFEGHYHLVNGRRADAKVLLHVGFGRRPAVQARVEVDEGQILALLGREGFCGATQTSHPLQLFVRASNDEEARVNVRYRVELSQTESATLTALLSGGKHAVRKLKRAQILLAADAGAGDEEIARSVGVGGSTVYRTKRRFEAKTISCRSWIVWVFWNGQTTGAAKSQLSAVNVRIGSKASVLDLPDWPRISGMP